MLAGWERRPAVPTDEVERIIVAAGCTPFPAWLHFHEQYAGYVEHFYHDGFVLGLAHAAPYWLAPNSVEIDGEGDGRTWTVWCADGHPSYSYQLDQTGEFQGHGGHRSFDLYVERLAALREFAPDRKAVRDLSREEVRGSEFAAAFADDIRPFAVADLCDQFWRYYQTPTHVVIENAESGTITRAWERVGGG